MVVLGCRDVLVKFGETVALDGVTLSWQSAGTVHAIVGQNGAGKTTLCRVFAGLTRADYGQVIVGGVEYPPSGQARLRKAGVELVHQTFALPPHFTVAEALQLFRSDGTRGGFYRRGAIERRWAGQLESFGFSIRADAFIRDLAPEQLQAVEITRALASGSRIIVLDEPTAVLPPEAIDGLFARLRVLATQGITFFVVMHKLRDVRAIAETVAVLAGGKVVLPPTEMSTISDTEIARLIMTGSAQSSVSGASVRAMGLHDEGRTLDDGGSEAGPLDVSVAVAQGDDEVAQDSGASPMVAQDSGASPMGDPALAGGQPDSSASSAIMRVEHVSTVTREGRRGLQAFSVDVHPGEVVGIAGVEGNGQQALVDVIVGLEAPREGHVILDGRDVSHERVAVRRRLGLRYIPADRQSRAISLSSSLWVNAMAAPVSSGYGVSGAVRRGFLSERLLRRSGEERLRRWQVRYASSGQAMRELSGGNLQRIVLAREVDEGARLIVAEQPTQGLDLGGTELVWDALRRARRSGAGVLLVSSDLDELFALSDRLVVILGGERVAVLRPPYDRTALGQAMVVGAAS